MKKMKLRRRILSILLAVCMMIPYMSIESYATTNDGEPSKEGTECCCEVRCTEENTNTECKVCMGDISKCSIEDKTIADEEEPAVGEEHAHNQDGGVTYVMKDAAYHTVKVACKDCPENYVSESDEVHSTAEEDDRIPNCTSKGYCTVCGSEYGEVDSEAHNIEEGKCVNANCDYVVVEPSDVGEEVVSNENGDNEATSEEVVENSCEHNDSNSDGVCDKEGCDVRVAYNVLPYSWLLNSDGESVANVSVNPSGYVEVGEKVTAVAPENLHGYVFRGWYAFAETTKDNIKDNMIIENSRVSTEGTLSDYVLTADTILLAVYEACGTGTVTLNGSGFSVWVNDQQEQVEFVDGKFTKDYPFGTQITIKVSEDIGFVDWRNEYKKIVTEKNEYTFTVTGNVELTMSKKGNNGDTVVEFVSDSKQVIKTVSCNKDNVAKIQFPEAPLKKGYTFKDWEYTKHQIYDMIVNEGATYIKVKPLYENEEKLYNVTVNVNGSEDKSLSQNGVKSGTPLAITAPETWETLQFAYWTDENDNVLGYNITYGMVVNGDVKINAVYKDSSEVVGKKPVIVKTDIYTTSENGKNKIAFSVTRNIPDNYTLVEHGMIASKATKQIESSGFVLGAKGVTKFAATTTSKFGVYTLNINMTGKEDTPIAARGYLIVKQGDGKEEIYYTDVMSKRYTDIAGCIHNYECTKIDSDVHSVSCTKDGCDYTLAEEAHTPSYSVVDGTTIQVSCTKNCGYVGSVQLNVKEMYCDESGELENAVVKTGDLEGNILVNYARKNGEPCDGIPKDVGTYIASITLGNTTTISEEFTIKHTDSNSDGKCDQCKEIVAYQICTDAKLIGADQGVKNDDNFKVEISKNPSGGYIIPGDSVVVTAPGMLDYKFKGWYLANDIDTGKLTGEPWSSSFSATFNPDDNKYQDKINKEKEIVLIAVYEEVERTATVTIEGKEFEVCENDQLKSAISIDGNIYKYKLTIGTEAKIKVSNPDFFEWRNEYGKKITDEFTYDFLVTGDLKLVMSEKVAESEENKALVEYVSDYGQVLYSNIHNSAEAIAIVPPSGPSKMGYVFEKWSLTPQEISVKIESENATYIQVTPVYQWIDIKYSVEVYVNGVKDMEQSKAEEAYPGESIIVNAPAKIGAKTFLYWTDEEGTILGYNTSYGIRISKDVTLKAVYGKEQVEQKPTIVMTDVYTIEESEKNKLVFAVTRDIPDVNKYTLVEHGVIAKVKKNVEDTITESDLVLGAEKVTKFAATSTKTSGVYTLAINVTNNETRMVVARGYLMVQKVDTGDIEIYYTDMVEQSYNDLKSTN